MRPVKYSTITKETNADARTFPLGNLCSKLSEKSENIRPLNVSRDGMSKDRCQSFEVFSFHRFLVPLLGTTVKVSSEGYNHSAAHGLRYAPPVRLGPVGFQCPRREKISRNAMRFEVSE
jgi:hypothetical protein